MVPHGTTINKNKNGVYDLYIYLQGVHLFTVLQLDNWCVHCTCITGKITKVALNSVVFVFVVKTSVFCLLCACAPV
jgi:hypothetical protein